MYKMRKDQADEFRADARRKSEMSTKKESDIRQLEKDKTDLDTKINEAYVKHRQAQKIRSDEQSKKQRLEELERNKMELEAEITVILDITVDELNREIEKYQLTKMERMAELEKLTQEQGRLERQCSTNMAAQQEKLVLLGKLQSEEEQYKKRIRERDQLLTGLARRFQWDDPGHRLDDNTPLNADQVKRFANLLKESAERAKREELECRRSMEDEEKRLLEAASRLREDRVRLEQNIKTKESAVAEHSKELSTVRNKLNQMEENSRQMIKLEADQEEAQRKVERAEKEMDVDKLKGDIVATKSSKQDLEVELDRCRAQLKRLMGQRDIRVKLEMFEKDLATKKRAQSRLMIIDDVVDAIKLLLGPDAIHKDELLAYYNPQLDTLGRNLDKDRQRQTKLGQEKAVIEADLRNLRRIIDDKKAELAGKMKRFLFFLRSLAFIPLNCLPRIQREAQGSGREEH